MLHQIEPTATAGPLHVDSEVGMDSLPAHRGLEVTAEVIDGAASIVWEQAANRNPSCA